jgi:hypothetical protein
MPNALWTWWARLTGGKHWDRQVALTKNTTDDEVPPQGFGQTEPVPRNWQDQTPRTEAEKHQRYEVWEGEDPGH